MNERLPNTTASTDATLFREEAERARRYAAAMIEKKVIDRLNEMTSSRPGKTLDRPIATKPSAFPVLLGLTSSLQDSQAVPLYRSFPTGEFLRKSLVPRITKHCHRRAPSCYASGSDSVDRA